MPSVPDDAKRTLTPKLRFPEFRGDWKNAVISDLLTTDDKPEKVATFESDKILTVKLHANGVVKNERTGALTGGTSYFRRKSGQFIFSKIDLLNGAFGIVPDEFDGFSSSTDIPAFSFAVDCSPAFFVNWLTANYERLEIERTGTSATLKRVSPEKFRALPIMLPSPAEQQKIADCLTSLDACVAAQGRKVEVLKAHKKGLMQQLFPREGETLPRLRFPEFRHAPDWRGRRIRDLLEKASRPIEVESEITYREIGIRSHGKGVFHKDQIKGSAIGTKRVFWVVEEAFILNIIFAWEQAVAFTTKAEAGMIASHRFPMFLPKSNSCDVRFLKLAFLTPTGKHLLGLASPGGAGRNRTLGQDEFDKIEIVVPEKDEQTKVAEVVLAADAQIATESEKLAALKTHKKGLMQQLFPAAGASQSLLAEIVINQHGAHRATVTVAATPEVDGPASVPLRKPYKIGFARQLLAAEILQHCHKHPTMGRVKLQKLIHLCEYHAELDEIHGHYARAAAGPFDNKLMRGVANGLKKQKWFKQVWGEKRTSYEPMESSGKHSKYLQRWSEKLPKIHEIIRRFATAKTLSCEIASTLYAAWNDLLIDGRHPTDEEIIREASDPKRWHESKASIEEVKWPTALKWMREHGLVPRGYGAHTTKQDE
jgi:type I restriction enzyme S subunit